MRTIQDFSQTCVCEDRKHHKGCDSQQERGCSQRDVMCLIQICIIFICV